MRAVLSEPEIITFGCRLNSFESEVMRGQARAAGLANAVIVNTCAVTAEAERQARQAIRRARRRHPEARILVTGCAAQIDPARYAAMPEVDRVLGNEEKLRIESYAPEADAPVAVSDILKVRETAGHLIDGFGGRARAFVQVQQGCDHRCTFCIIPYGRGNSRSVPVGEVVAQVRRLVARGVAEVVLTGVDIASYGADLPGRPSLGQLARRLLRLVPELRRLRLSSLDPAVADEALFRLLTEEPRLMPHLHLSLQSGSDLILKRMKRRHLMADAAAWVARARAARPDLALGADLIAGFPTETEADLAATLDAVAGLDLAFLHVFPYSPRAGTPAARMPQVPAPARKSRAARLRKAGERAHRRFLEGRIGRRAQVLIERDGFGHSEHFAPVATASGRPGEILSVALTGIEQNRLLGEPTR